MQEEKLQALQKKIDKANNIVFFGGAGVSTESGIPDFRSTDGLFNQQYDWPPEVIVSHSFFEQRPEDFFRFLRDRMIFPDAQPNAAHKALAKLEEQGIKGMFCHSHGSIVHVAVDGAYFGHIVIRDMLKPTSVQAVQALHQNGVRETVMLTGDREEVAREVADELGITDVQSGLLPEDKVRIVEEMMAKTKEKEAGGKHRSILAFVGDGINDAPVLARADVGVAMGALGADAAIEAADIVLMDDDPLKIAEAIRISRKCMRIVRENIVGAIGIKVLVLVLSAIGMATMELAIFADVGVMILAVLNAMRALRVNSL